jgi:hypothetical protein
MRKLLAFLSIATIMFACGEAGVGFNLSTEFPVTAPFEVPIPTAPDELLDLLDVNPPSESIEYSLGSVDAFSDDLNDLGEVRINAIYYEITDLDATESAIDLDEFSITLKIGSVDLPLVSNTGGQLENVAKTEIALSNAERDQLVQQLLNNQPIGADILFDLASIPSGLSNLDMDFTMYFDVTIGIDVEQ